jgi:hypothetical protein
MIPLLSFENERFYPQTWVQGILESLTKEPAS